MKILIGDLSVPSKRGDWDEPGILKVLQKNNSHSPGYGHICHLHDSFIHQGPNGNHICLVLEAMGLSVLDLYGALPGAMPLELLERVCKHVLYALQYLHEECGIIHTGKMFQFIRSCLFFSTLTPDIKGDNILMTSVPSEEERADIELDNDFLMSTTFKK
jgi:serine/threonine-protein kinase SRPK3